MCYAPINIRDPDHEKESVRMLVPCGKCLECLQSKRAGWSFRLEQEWKISSSAYFVTLTYEDKHLTYGFTEPSLVKDDLKHYIKNVRNRNRKQKVRYYACGEYGTETHRPHYHLIIFNIKEKDSLVSSWKKGFVKVETCNSATINYVTKYLITKNIRHTEKQPEFSLMSKKLGYNYVKTHGKYHEETGKQIVRMNNGQFVGIPRYIKDKVWTKYDKKMYAESTRIKLEKYNQKLEEMWRKKGLTPDKVRQDSIDNRIRQFHKKNKKHGNI